MDHLSAMQKVPFAAQGYASYFCLSTMDRYYHSEMTLEEGIALLKKCLKELETRFIVNFSKINIKVIDKDGIREIVL